MYNNIPDITYAAAYARTDMQQLAREIMRLEGIYKVNQMVHNL